MNNPKIITLLLNNKLNIEAILTSRKLIKHETIYVIKGISNNSLNRPSIPLKKELKLT